MPSWQRVRWTTQGRCHLASPPEPLTQYTSPKDWVYSAGWRKADKGWLMRWEDKTHPGQHLSAHAVPGRPALSPTNLRRSATRSSLNQGVWT